MTSTSKISPRFLVICLLVSVGLFSLTVSAQRYAGDRSSYDNKTPRTFEVDAIYDEECGSCHLAYPPGLLPAKSWQRLLLGLEDHFGENAELGSEEIGHLTNYLLRNSLEKETSPIISKLSKNVPVEPPIRISELPQFHKEHESSVRQLGGASLPVGFFSPCEDCHKEAASGIFNKEKIYKGYGPSFEIGAGKNK